jgi:hypothetical protein
VNRHRSFGDEAEKRAGPVEAPGAALFDYFETLFVMSVKQLVADLPGRVLVREF